MKDNQFDDFIKNKLKHQESAVPVNMWERIASQKKDRKSGFKPRLFLLLTAFVFIGFTGIFVFTPSHVGSKEVASAKTNTSKTAHKKQSSTVKNNNGVPTLAIDNIKPADNLQEDNSAINSDIAIQKHKQSEKYIYAKRKKEKRQFPYKPSRSKESWNDSNNNLALNDPEKGSAYENNSADSLVKDPLQQNNTAGTDSAAVAATKQYGKSDDRFSLELYTSPNIPINGIRAADKTYEQVLKNAGNMRVSYLIGARLNYEITRKFSAKIGVQYAQVNEKVAFIDSLASTAVNSTNRYRHIGVPLLVTYKTGLFRNLDLAINTGIILNINSRFKGTLPSASGEPVDLRNNDVYNRNASTLLYLSLDVSKQINSRTDFFVEPWFNYRLKNMVSHYYLFNQKIHTSGLALGLRYRLYKSDGQ